MIRFPIGIVLLFASLASQAAPPKNSFDILVEAQGCTTTIRAPSRILIGPNSPEFFRTESFSHPSSIALEVALASPEVFRVRGSYLTTCGNISIDSSARIGKTVMAKSGKLRISVTLSRANN